MAFLIRHPETKVEYELDDVAFFQAQYQPEGFEIVDAGGYDTPEVPKAPKASKDAKKAKDDGGAGLGKHDDGDSGTGDRKP